MDALRWSPAPAVLPKGAEIAVLSGDPGSKGPFTARLRFPAGYRIPAHRHSHSEPVTVISGELNVGSGTRLDEKRSTPLGPGAFIELPAGQDHFAFTHGGAVIQIATEGPFDITYADPADDPSH
jgi:quercetin dioxygenase-like cupin family protein